MKFTTKRMTEIDPRDERFRIQPPGAADALTESIRDVGLVNPPVLVDRDDRFVILSGWKRFEACGILGMERIPVFTADIPEDGAAFRLPVYENLSVRSYSQAEKADILKKLRAFGVKDETLLRRFLPLLGIPAAHAYLERYLRYAEFEPETRDWVHRTNPDESALRILAEFSPDERKTVLPLIQPLGRNKSKQVITDLYELKRIRDTGTEKILGDEDIRAALDDPELSPRQKAEIAHARLRTMRLPRLSAQRRAFQVLLDHLNLDSGIVVNPAPFFEDEQMTLQVTFRSREELLDRLSLLRKAGDSREFNDLIRLLTDE